MADLKDIKEQVEQRLQTQQASKEFKDIGRVSLTRKETSAYKLITGQVLNQLEEDVVMAYNMVKKENVWPEINVNDERSKGVTSGAAYIKVKIREAVPTRPQDEKVKRATYVLFLEQLQKDLLTCYTVDQVSKLAQSYRELPMDKIIGYFLNPDFLTATDDKKKEIELVLKQNRHIQVAFIYGGSSLVLKLVKEVFSARFENALFNRSDASIVMWRDAKDKEPITPEEAKELITKLELRKINLELANQKTIQEYKDADAKALQRLMDGWTIHAENKKAYKQNIELFREFALSYFERRYKLQVAAIDKNLLEIKPKDNDWSWFDSPQIKATNIEKNPKQTPINTKSPLAYIKRIGGYKIEANSAIEIIEKFGFSAVNYGVYVDDQWSKEHTKHFLGAMSDMGQVLNIDIKQMNQLGKLAIAFGAKGRKGHAAAYFPQTKDINLTKGNGDGSVAHEWGHYFDNVLVELDQKSATNRFASEGYFTGDEIKILFKELLDFFYKGNPLYTPKIPMRFPAKSSEQPPSYSVYLNGAWQRGVIEIKATIEDTLAQLESFAVVDMNNHATQIRLFGYVIHAFGLDHYDIPMRLKTSYQYHKSAYYYFEYCGSTLNGIKILAKPRSKYWTSAVELFARAWETVILKKIIDQGRASNYLVNEIPLQEIISESFYEPYPSGKELDYIENILDRIIVAVKKQFNISDFIPPSQVIEDEYLDLSDKKTGKVTAGMVVDNGNVAFVADSVIEAVSTLTMLMKNNATADELTEWQTNIDKLNALINKE
jgi:hypothetical protein